MLFHKSLNLKKKKKEEEIRWDLIVLDELFIKVGLNELLDIILNKIILKAFKKSFTLS